MAAYPNFYKEIKIIPTKKYKPFIVDCQFGEDNYYGSLDNVPDDWRKEMESFPVFLDMHLDALKWTKYDFDWFRYFYFFPKPEIKSCYPNPRPKDYVVFHLASETSGGHKLDQFYIDLLIQKISQFIPCFIISTPKTNDLYENIRDLSNVTLFNGSIAEVFDLIQQAKVMVSTDSGFRYIAHGCGIPVLTFSAQSPAPHQALPSHQLRWLLFPNNCFPLNYNASYISKIVKNILDEKAVGLYPFVTDFDTQMVRRKYTINKEKSILNEN